jgi:hypothetical protein
MGEPLGAVRGERIGAAVSVHDAGCDMHIGLLEHVDQFAEDRKLPARDLAELELIPEAGAKGGGLASKCMQFSGQTLLNPAAKLHTV